MSEVKAHDTIHEEYAPSGNGNFRNSGDPEMGINRQMTTVTLSPEQFESLYLQPKGARAGLIKGLGNSTALFVSPPPCTMGDNE